MLDNLSATRPTMKKLLHVILLLICTYTVNAQKIHFTDTSNKWTVWYRYQATGLQTNIYSYTGDTTINGLQYRVSQFGLVREDTASHKVYIKNCRNNTGIQFSDTNELVLYDYNLVVGDTVRYIYGKPNDSFVSYVKTVDSVKINNTWHRTWLMEPLVFSQHYTVIEGVGSTAGPWIPVHPAIFEDGWTLKCFYNNGIHPTVVPAVAVFGAPAAFDNDQSCALAIQDIDKWNKNVKLVPNPANSRSRILLPNEIMQGRLTIVNTIGQTVYAHFIKNETEIYIGDKLNAAGIYFYTVTDELTGHRYAGKFVYE